jgi:hypothetical protein
MPTEEIEWDEKADDVYSYFNEKKREYPMKNMLILIDDLAIRGVATQADMIEKHGSADFIATTLGHVTTAIYGKGSVPKIGGWYKATTSPHRYDIHPGFSAAWISNRKLLRS